MIYTGDIDGSHYVKTPRLLDYEDFTGTDYLARVALGEVESHELLRQSPHPNIVKYHGWNIRRGRILGMVLDRYAVTLLDKSGRRRTTRESR